MAKSAEYLGKGTEWSTKAIGQLQGLVGLLIPTYGYDIHTNNTTGEVIWIIYQIDPVTQKRTVIGRYSLGNIGQRTIKTSIWDQYGLSTPSGTSSNAGSTPSIFSTNWDNLPSK